VPGGKIFYAAARDSCRAGQLSLIHSMLDTGGSEKVPGTKNFLLHFVPVAEYAALGYTSIAEISK